MDQRPVSLKTFNQVTGAFADLRLIAWQEWLRLQRGLLDVKCSLEGQIAVQSALRARQLGSLRTVLQTTLDGLKDSLSEAKSPADWSAAGASTASNGPGSAGAVPVAPVAVPANPPRRLLESGLGRLEGRLAVRMGEFRTRVEAVKLRSIYAFTMGLAGVFLAVVVSRKRSEGVRV